MKSDGLKIFADVACLILLFPILNPEPGHPDTLNPHIGRLP
jgi:hypothetical protein